MSVLEQLGLARTIKELLHRGPNDDVMGMNFLRYGPAMKLPGIDEFVTSAVQFREEAEKAVSDGAPGYTRVRLSEQRVAYDHSTAEGSQKRGIYTLKGVPVSYYKPDFKASGYATAAEELSDFKNRGIAEARSR